ncbi:MAG TPA: hypothetical protein DD645_00275, partial [Olsenella sp.]|nr:hypothetical protein [Olsenella sp.]
TAVGADVLADARELAGALDVLGRADEDSCHVDPLSVGKTDETMVLEMRTGQGPRAGAARGVARKDAPPA